MNKYPKTVNDQAQYTKGEGVLSENFANHFSTEERVNLIANMRECFRTQRYEDVYLVFKNLREVLLKK